MKAEAILEIRDLDAGYGTRQILYGVSATIIEGTVTAVIGPNGAGKSTLLKAVAGLVERWRGEIRFLGRELSKSSPDEILALGVSMVPQGRCNFPLMTVRENLEMGAYTRREREVANDLEEMETRFPVLKKKRRMLAGNLSGGEQQILEMAMALMLRPRLLLLDEPSLGLAPGPMGQVFQEVQRIAASGISVLMVEQNARRALEIGDQALVLDLGRLRMTGTGREVLEDREIRRLYLGGGQTER
ncbi:MAG: ABC transporter ATP-binding protein [Thermodesulfobacteriota bacterium]